MSHKCLGGCGKYIADDRHYCLSCEVISKIVEEAGYGEKNNGNDSNNIPEGHEG